MEGRTAASIATATLGGAIARAAFRGYQNWKKQRNALPDEERDALFWNDRRYGAYRAILSTIYSIVIWGGGALLILIVGFLIAENRGWLT